MQADARAPTDAGPPRSRRAVDLQFAIAAALFAYWFALAHVQTPEWEPVDFAHMVDGTARTPMQYRVLLPALVGAIRGSGIPGAGTLPLVVYRLLLDFVAGLAVLYAARSFWRALGLRPGAAAAASFLFAAALPFHFLLPEVRFHYVYDLPALAAFTAGLTCLLRGRWVAFYLVFVLGTFNRETTLFLTLVYVATAFGRTRKTTLAAHTAAQLLAWAAIKGWLWSLYRGNTDRAYLDHMDLFKDSLLANLRLLRYEPDVWFTLASTWGFAWVFALIGWRRADPFLRRAALVVPVFCATMCYVGEIQELRIYAEVLPIVLGVAVTAQLRGDPANAIDQFGTRPSGTQ